MLAKHKHGTNDDGSWALEFTTFRALRFQATPPGSDIVFDSEANIVFGEWNHIAFTYNEESDHYDFYINGDPAGSGTANLQNAIQNTSRPFRIGCMENNPVNFTFDGHIDEVQVWKEYRTEADIEADMACSR